MARARFLPLQEARLSYTVPLVAVTLGDGDGAAHRGAFFWPLGAQCTLHSAHHREVPICSSLVLFEVC